MSGRCGAGWALMALVLLAPGCGYRFVTPNSTLPKGVDRVQVPVFRNNTSEPGAEELFTDALRELYLHAGKLGDDSAGVQVEGTLLSIYSTPLVATPGRLPTTGSTSWSR